MRTKIRWAPSALTELRAARAWIRAHNRPAAARFAESVKRAVGLLAEFPHLGAVALDIEPQGRYRHIIHGRYRIIYRVDAGVVYILRFWDCRRDPSDLTPIE